MRILIADDSQILRQALIKLVSRDSHDLAICGEAADGEEAVRKVEELQPDVVLLDLSLPILNGLQVVEILKKNHPGTMIVLVSQQSADAMRALTEPLGIRGVVKSSLATELIPLLRSMIGGSPTRD